MSNSFPAPGGRPTVGEPYKPASITCAEDVMFAALHPDADGAPPADSIGLLLLIEGEWRGFVLPLPDDPAYRATVQALVDE